MLQLKKYITPLKIYLNDFLIYKSIKIKVPIRENQNTYKGDNKNSHKGDNENLTKGKTKTRKRQKTLNNKKKKKMKWN